MRRSPQATAREFARSIAAVADAGLREEEATASDRPRGVQVMTMHAAKGLEFDHVYVLGLFAARMPGPRRRTLEPIPDALIAEELPPDTKAAHVAEMRRLLHVAMTRARRRLVLAYPERTDRGAVQQPSPFLEEARAAVGGGLGGARGGAVRAGRDAAVDVPDAARRAARRRSRRSAGAWASCASTPTSTSRTRSCATSSCSSSRRCSSARGSGGLSVAEALPEVNARLLQSATAEQREIFETSALDDYLLDAERDEKLPRPRGRRSATSRRSSRSCRSAATGSC